MEQKPKKSISFGLKSTRIFTLAAMALLLANCSVDVPALMEEGKNAFYNGNYVEAKEAFKKCADEGDSQGQFWLGYLTLLVNGHYSETDTLVMSRDGVISYCYDLFKKSADQNDGDGYVGKYIVYSTDIGDWKDKTKAIEALDKAVELNSYYGIAEKGLCLVKGNGYEQNIDEGVKLIKQSADNGNDAGITYLGTLYVLGNGVSKDINKGIELLKNGANHGNRSANDVLANLYFWGIEGEVSADESKAYKYAMNGSANNGNTALVLGFCYEYGKGVAQDDPMAAVYFRRSALAGLPGGQYMWGMYCEKGYGSKQEALDNFLLAANQGHPTSMYKVGQYYLLGITGESDYAKARLYLQGAAQQGVEEAKDMLKTYAILLY
ncbi:MAG: sel1 repeat family protein [Veillonella sp.]|nr:sel1 repeat family protein [Veillonella sp.]